MESEKPINIVDLAQQGNRREKLERLRGDMLLQDIQRHRGLLRYLLKHGVQPGVIPIPIEYLDLYNNLRLEDELDAESAG